MITDTTGAHPSPPVTSMTSPAAYFLQRPAAPERSAQAHLVAGLQRGQALGDASLRTRMVWPMTSRSSGSDMMEIGTSPTP
ncbi:MAG: hypothetical protein U5L03_16530 [Burkholderiaceae bacterium]|nr:hypothetical protein [Burkholderiaceae bacterium]